MVKKNPFGEGDKVRFKDEDNDVYTVYAVYSPTEVSLGLLDYPDTEMDYLTNIDKLVLVKKKKTKVKM